MRWGSELFESTTTSQGCNAEATILCASDVNIRLSATNITGSNEYLLITVTSNSNVPLKGFWFRGRDKDEASSNLAGNAFSKQELQQIDPYGSH